MRVRSLVSADAASVARLVAASFDVNLHPYIAYCQQGLTHFLTVVAGTPAAFPDYHLYVVESSRCAIVGFAEFRSSRTSTCILSYICVSQEVRRQGLARRLIATHLQRVPAVTSVELDVFVDNLGAQHLYDSLGFSLIRTSRWRKRILPDPSPERGSLRVSDWHISYASLKRYGFCMLSAEFRGRKLYGLGLPSPAVLRVGNREQFIDDQLMSSIRLVLPFIREVLLIDGDGVNPPGASQQLLISRRLEAAAAMVLDGCR